MQIIKFLKQLVVLLMHKHNVIDNIRKRLIHLIHIERWNIKRAVHRLLLLRFIIPKQRPMCFTKDQFSYFIHQLSSLTFILIESGGVEVTSDVDETAVFRSCAFFDYIEVVLEGHEVVVAGFG